MNDRFDLHIITHHSEVLRVLSPFVFGNSLKAEVFSAEKPYGRSLVAKLLPGHPICLLPAGSYQDAISRHTDYPS